MFFLFVRAANEVESLCNDRLLVRLYGLSIIGQVEHVDEILIDNCFIYKHYNMAIGHGLVLNVAQNIRHEQ